MTTFINTNIVMCFISRQCNLLLLVACWDVQRRVLMESQLIQNIQSPSINTGILRKHSKTTLNTQSHHAEKLILISKQPKLMQFRGIWQSGNAQLLHTPIKTPSIICAHIQHCQYVSTRSVCVNYYRKTTVCTQTPTRMQRNMTGRGRVRNAQNGILNYQYAWN